MMNKLNEAFEQVESELLNHVFDIAEGDRKVFMKEQWADFKEVITDLFKEKDT